MVKVWRMTAVVGCLGSENELKIINTQLDHKRIHKFTWRCQGLQSIIDYFLVRSDQRRYVHDVRVIRGTEIESDHYLELAKVNTANECQREMKIGDK